MRALRLDSIWRGFEYFNQFPARKILFLLRQADADALARQSKWDEDRAAVGQASHGVTAIGEFV
jgi:hypothetical protein